MSDIKLMQEQNVILNDRRSITVTGIKSVDSFDETLIVASTVDNTVINVEGTGLSIKDVNLDRGQFEADGAISAVFYESGKTENNGGFLRRLLRKQ